mgnify:CR=1 FL=1
MLKGFPGENVGYFSSGTGFAGIFGSGILIILHAAKLNDWLIYLLAAPTMIPYILCVRWLVKQMKTYRFEPESLETKSEV